MKKRVIACFLLFAMLFSLSGCGKFTCGMCGEEKSGKKYESEIMGEKVTMCPDCYNEIKQLQKDFFSD